MVRRTDSRRIRKCGEYVQKLQKGAKTHRRKNAEALFLKASALRGA